MGRSDEIRQEFERLNAQAPPQEVIRVMERVVVENARRLDEIEKMLHA